MTLGFGGRRRGGWPRSQPRRLARFTLMLGLAQHARLRMRARGITEPEIEQALARADSRYPSQDDPDRIVVFGVTEAGRLLKIVVLARDPEYVVTVADRSDDR